MKQYEITPASYKARTTAAPVTVADVQNVRSYCRSCTNLGPLATDLFYTDEVAYHEGWWRLHVTETGHTVVILEED